ncbi:MAG TPA: phenylalanine--tRNA ligase subunit beta [Candidatus Magasanikbacteria bacterium]|nr:phenylalanine--tRNA ligase subunit beta [Candidatus Magasanikbacteria bacterium]
MLISFNWLKKYVDLPDSITAEDVADRLKLSTVEVESVVFQGAHLEQVVVGEILEIKNHPNADKLHLAQVDVGEKKPRQIVFGQMVKMEVGFKVPVALAPTVLPGNKVIEKVEMRGELTEGMLCLDQEIGLLKDGVSIQFFDKKVKNGTSVVEALKLNDYILEVDNKSLSNRPDLWGHYGMAWEVAALFNKKVADLDIKEFKPGKDVKLKIKIEDTENCTRYIGAVVGGIKIEPSPKWMQDYLKACGVKAINNVVDITNFVNLELGRPSHAFDRRDIKDDTIIVRRAVEGERLTTLDGIERVLKDTMCLVCDAEKPVDLGGIMGGENSEIKPDTTEVILELANFNAANIRKTMSAFDLRTDAGVRFEKTLSPHLAELGLKRILTLMKEIIPTAHLISKVVNINNDKAEKRSIELSPEYFTKKMGVELDKKQVVKILQSLGFSVVDKKANLLVSLPLWRSVKDISIPEDLVEEIARIYGYANIPAEMPVFPTNPPELNILRKLERQMKEILSLENGYSEVYNYSFVAPEFIKRIGLSTEELIELDNPIAKDRPYLRHNLWPSLLENIETNQRQAEVLRLFEIGKVFRIEQAGMRVGENSDELLPRQDTLLCLVCAGKNIAVPFFEVGEAFKSLMAHFNAEVEYKPNEKVADAFVHVGRQALVFVNGKEVGAVAELNPMTQKNLGLEARVGILEINLDELLPVLTNEKKYVPLPQYPVVVRDIAFVVDRKITHAEIVQALTKIDPLIVSVELFDVYSGKNLGENKKSLAYHITYQSLEKTLESGEVDKVHTKLIAKLEKEFQAEVRK